MNIKSVQGSLGAYQSQMERSNKADAAKAASHSSQSTKGQSANDKVNVSTDGMLRTTAFAAAMRSTDVRQEKVDSIKQSLSDGTYTIDNRKIAEKIVQEESSIFRK